MNYQEFAKKFDLEPFGDFESRDLLHMVWKFSLNISPSQLWPSIADTSLFNRDLGLQSRTETEVDGFKVVRSDILGFRQEWIEEPWSWVKEKSMHSVRRYRHGMAKAIRSNFYIEPKSGGVDFYVNFSWVPQNFFWRAVLKLSESALKAKFQKTLAKIEKAVGSSQAVPISVLKFPNDPTLNVNLVELDRARTKLKGLKLNPAAVESLCEFIKYGDDADLFRIRVLDLAARDGLPKRDVLMVCMQSVRLGLLTISWDVICPHCRGVRVAADSLGQISARAECLVCDVDFATDALESIEVTFHVQPSIRKVQEVLFCAAEPAKKDHIQVQANLAPGESLQISQNLQEGRHRIRIQGFEQKLHFEIARGTENQKILWDMETSLEKQILGPATEFFVKNSSHQAKTISLEQLWWKDNILHPADVFSIQDFQDVFSRESLNADVKLSLGHQVILFTDIVNSSGYYARNGDATAFNEVKNHFTSVFGKIHRNEGAVIKTIGDSVMACFLDHGAALRAAIEIHEAFPPRTDERALRLRVSIHMGNVIAVHLSQGLDLFGMTVNKAAKLQACAGAGQVAMSTDVFEACRDSVLRDLTDFISERKSVKVSSEMQIDAVVLSCDEFKKISGPREKAA